MLIAGGVLNLAYGALLGYPIVVIRAKGAPATPRYLLAAHVGALLHAAVLLGLVWAARLSALGPAWNEVAAWLVVISSALVAAKDTVNRLTGVQPAQPVPWLAAPQFAGDLPGTDLAGVSAEAVGACAVYGSAIYVPVQTGYR